MEPTIFKYVYGGDDFNPDYAAKLRQIATDFDLFNIGLSTKVKACRLRCALYFSESWIFAIFRAPGLETDMPFVETSTLSEISDKLFPSENETKEETKISPSVE